MRLFKPCALPEPGTLMGRVGASSGAALLALGLLAACSATPPDAATTVAQPTETTSTQAAPTSVAVHPAVPAIAVPPVSVGQWIDLGLHQSAWLGGDAPVPASGTSTPTRVAGLQAEDGRWLAVIVLQQSPAASAPCPTATRLHVRDSGPGCLRLRRNADFDLWLEKQHPVLHDWIDSQGWATHPRAWVSLRMDSVAGGSLETHALLHPSLIEPTTRDNSDFLAGGQPGLRWARQFAEATRAVAASGQARLQVPPFPFVAPTDRQLLADGASAEKSQASKTQPAAATQVAPRPPAARARQDRH